MPSITNIRRVTSRVCMLPERAEIMAQAIARSPGQLRVYRALPENAARKAGAEGAYGRSVISSRRRLQVADGYGVPAAAAVRPGNHLQ